MKPTILYIMSETNTKFTPEQIKVYGEMHNLFPLNHEALIANQMRLEGMIQDLPIAIETINTIIDSLDIVGLKIERIQKYIERNIELQVDL